MTKIIFFGTPKFSANILTELHANYEVALVVTQPDKAVGRTQEVQETVTALEAHKLGIPVLKPQKLKDPEFINKLKEIKPELFVVVAYGKIIPKEILEIPFKAPLNIHGSLLPKHRGASPIHTALLNGDSSTGITIMIMDELMDHGPTLSEKEIPISPDETYAELEQRLCELAKELIIQTIPDFLDQTIKPKEQDHDQATVTKIIDKTDGLIDWNKTAEQIYNQYRAYHLWPQIYTTWQGLTLKITKAGYDLSIVSNSARGTVFKVGDKAYVGTGKGALELIEVQLEGKKNMAIKDFLNGHKDFLKSKLG